MKEILSSLEALFLQFNVRRLLFWLFLLILAVGAFVSYESLSGHFFFSRTERKVALLRELHSLHKEGIIQNDNLGPIYQELVSELAGYRIEPLSVARLARFDLFWKFISGAFLGLAFTLASLVGRDKEGWKSTVYGGVVLAIILGGVGVLIPTIYNPWVNYFGYPAFQLIAFFAIAKLTGMGKD